MNILIRGDLPQRLRLLSGLVLLVFLATHLANHALGLVSLDWMERVQGWRKLVWRSWPGSVLLLAAFAVHIGLATWKLARRRTWRMPPWEAAQIASGLLIPTLLIQHVIYNRVAASVAGTNDSYRWELANLWPDFAWDQFLLILLAWGHAMIGVRYWLGLAPWFRRVQPVLFAVAVALPVLAIAGFTVAGREVAREIALPGARAALQAAVRAPDDAAWSTITAVHVGLKWSFATLLAVVLGWPLVRAFRAATGAGVEIRYRGGPNIKGTPGMTLLEMSRAAGVAHASVCGGRARCSTCRVGIDAGLETLPRPTGAEAATLTSIGAAQHVRLACQLRPVAPLSVTRLVAPGLAADRRGTSALRAEDFGEERSVAVLFLDLRGFTEISADRLPYDVVFILNRLFSVVGDVVRRNGGHIDKYMGDGLMAVFSGDRSGGHASAACLDALSAAADADIAVEQLSREISQEIGRPLRIGMGMEFGPLVVGRIGHPDTAARTVIGATVNAASRYEQLTKTLACQLVVSRRVLDEAGLVGALPAGQMVEVRGFALPVEVVAFARAGDLPLGRANRSV